MRILAVFTLVFLYWQCQPNKVTPPATQLPDLTALARMTHREAVDTLRADTTRPLQPIDADALTAAAARKVLDSIDLVKVLKVDWPDNGFYGDNRYRIEFIFTDVVKHTDNPYVYTIKGKNRYKKTISEFAGTLEIERVATFVDPNLDTSEIEGLNFDKQYTLSGKFAFHEDSTLKTSGLFAGTFLMDIALTKDGGSELWFFSQGTPAKGCGYRFDGNWTSYFKAENIKPVIWSRDLFQIGNDILEEFSWGERDVEINPKYRNLGWDEWWSGEEWWNPSGKKEM